MFRFVILNNEIYNKIIRNDIQLPKTIAGWKDRLASLKCPTLTHDIFVTAKGVKTHILDT